MPRLILRTLASALLGVAALGAGSASESVGPSQSPTVAGPEKPLIRVGAAQPKRRLIDYRQRDPRLVLEEVNTSLDALVALVNRGGELGCDVLALPEDTLGLGHWEAGNQEVLSKVLPDAVDRMLGALGKAAASHRMYLVCSNDTVDADGSVRNTAFFLGRDGREIGRYEKVNMPIHELYKKRGNGFPVFETPDLGGVGMLICYDMVFPEAARCLALGGADIIFNPTLGGAAVGDGDISRAAFRTRAAENFVYVVVAQRGAGSMIIAPTGKVLADGGNPDDIVTADVNPFGGRQQGDAMNFQQDMRARLFRERSPAAFGILTDPNPPALGKVPEATSVEDASRIANGVLTDGEHEFRAAAELLADGKRDEAILAFEALIEKYPKSWIDRVSRQRLGTIDPERYGNPD
jgi:predicted amidohydrolase